MATSPKETLVPSFSVISHPYQFQVGEKTFFPDSQGFYSPKTEEEIEAFKHFASKGLCTETTRVG